MDKRGDSRAHVGGSEESVQALGELVVEFAALVRACWGWWGSDFVDRFLSCPDDLHGFIP